VQVTQTLSATCFSLVHSNLHSLSADKYRRHKQHHHHWLHNKEFSPEESTLMLKKENSFQANEAFKLFSKYQFTELFESFFLNQTENLFMKTSFMT
jgi:hypothetical protein